jgi:hypothetical protein
MSDQTSQMHTRYCGVFVGLSLLYAYTKISLHDTNHSEIAWRAGLSPENLYIEHVHISGRFQGRSQGGTAPADASAERTAGTTNEKQLRVGVTREDSVRSKVHPRSV